MTIYQGKSTKKFTGGKLRRNHSKRRYELGREPSFTKVGDTERRAIRTMGGNRKLLLLKEQYANIYNPEDKTIISLILRLQFRPDRALM